MDISKEKSIYTAVVKYAYFDRLTGKGELGKATLLIDNDASGNAEENLSVSGSLEKTGANPVEFTYQGFGGYTVISEKPADWDTKYTEYFIRENGAFKSVPAAGSDGSAPEWVKDKYYSKEEAVNTK